jgi:DNA modification methylase
MSSQRFRQSHFPQSPGEVDSMNPDQQRIDSGVSGITSCMSGLADREIAKGIKSALGDAGAIGIAPRQIAIKLKIDREIVKRQLNEMNMTGDVITIGRNLWMLPKYEKIENVSSFRSPQWYQSRFEKDNRIEIQSYAGKITFNENGNKHVHRWSPYVQGFSSTFVKAMIDRYEIKPGMCIADPFLGSGTVAVCAKMSGIDSIGIEVMPLMVFMARVKAVWNIDTEKLKLESISIVEAAKASIESDFDVPFLTETKRQFTESVMNKLLRLRWAIDQRESNKITNLFKLAFASILIDVSKLWRAPSLGYTKKRLENNAPYVRFESKIDQIIEDLKYVDQLETKFGKAKIVVGDSKKYRFKPNSIDFAITSPPYINGMDYVLNYKIETAWLRFASDYDELRKLREKMIACDNLSHSSVREFSKLKRSFQDGWLSSIVNEMGENLAKKTISRRKDMHMVVQKYFEDLCPVLQNVYDGLKENGRFVMVIGDSLMSGVYVPADLILARMGKSVGFEIESVEIARQRRSGQRRDFVLRESIVVLSKGKPKRKKITNRLDDFI